MTLARVAAPFDHPDWIFELKHDGFRAIAYIELFEAFRGNPASSTRTIL
jgi:ATP-dependent DNA ligase